MYPSLFDRLAHNLGRRITDYREDPGVSRVLRRAIQEGSHGYIVVRSIEQTAASGALDAGLPVLTDVDDLEVGAYRSRMEVPGLPQWKRLVLRHHEQQLVKIMPGILPKISHIWLCSDSDRGLVSHQSISILPNIPHKDPPAKVEEANSANNAIAFFGSMSHRVNLDGLEFFLENCWPRILTRNPQAVLRVYGAGMGEDLKRRWSGMRNVEPLGFVETVDQVYGNCLFTVVPLFEGGGTKIKVLESLAFGRTAVVTPHAQRGFENVLRHEDSLLVAHTADDIVSCCSQLIDDDSLRQRLAERGRHQVIKHFSYNRFQNAVREAFLSIENGRSLGASPSTGALEGDSN
jgi:hypothetical protein